MIIFPWGPILLAAVIVLGLTGGLLMQQVLKEVLPLLRTMVQERQANPKRAELEERVAILENHLASLESGQRELLESNRFLQRVLEARLAEPELPSSTR